MIPELSSLAARVRGFISGFASGHSPSEDSFDRLALDLFALQFRHVGPYRRLCEARGVNPETVRHWSGIPAVPTSAFREFELSSISPEERTHWFRSSGTTGQVASRHFHSAESLALYEASLLEWWRVNVLVGGREVQLAEARGSVPLSPAISLGEGEGLIPSSGESVREISRTVRLIMLTPPPESAPHSSLVHMFATLRHELGSEDSAFVGTVDQDGSWGVNAEAAVQCLSGYSRFGSRRSEEVEHYNFGTRNSEVGISGTPPSVGGYRVGAAPVVVMGTAFSFVHLLDWMTERGINLHLPDGSHVMETGGYKGRSRELAKAELHRLIADRLGVAGSNIICEYGMSELSSQAYDVERQKEESRRKKERRVFHFPSWVRVKCVSPETGEEAENGETGLIRVFDLANVWSVMAVQTEDLGIRRGDGFEFVGRATLAEARGCSLMAV